MTVHGSAPSAGYMLVGRRRDVYRTVDLGDGVIVDLDADGAIVGIETIGRTDWQAVAWHVLSNPQTRVVPW